LVFQLVQRAGIVAETLEAAQFAKGLVNFNALMNGDIDAIHRHRLNAESRLFVIFPETVNQVIRGRDTL